MNEQEFQKNIFDLQNGDEQQRRAASYKLSRSLNPLAVPALIQAYKDPDGSLRKYVIDGLRYIGTQEAIDFLNAHNFQSYKVENKNPEAKAIFAGLVALIVVFVIGIVGIVAVDIMTGEQIGGFWLTVLGVVSICVMVWVNNLVRRENPKLSTQTKTTILAEPISSEQKTTQEVQKDAEVTARPIGNGIKASIHMISIGLPALLLLLPGIVKNPELLSVGVVIVSFLLFALCIAFLYFFAGGFDWKPEKMSSIRVILFLLITGLIFGWIFYIYWRIVRWLIARIINIPFAVVKGKLLT